MNEIYSLVDLYKHLGFYKKDLTGEEIAMIFTGHNLAEYLQFKEDSDTELIEINGISIRLRSENRYMIDYGKEFRDKLDINDIDKMNRECIKLKIDTGKILDTTNLRVHHLKIEVPNVGNNKKSRCFNISRHIVQNNYMETAIEGKLKELQEEDPETYNEIIEGNKVLKVELMSNGRSLPFYRNVRVTKGTTNAVLDIQKNLYDGIYEVFSKEKYSKVHETVGGEDTSISHMGMYSTYKWALDNINLGLEVNNRVSEQDLTKEETNKIYKEIVINTLGINKGDICLFSVGKFRDSVNNIPETEYMTAIDSITKEKIDKAAKKKRPMKLLNSNSFALSRVHDIEDEHLVIEVSYESAGSIISRIVPVKWELFFPPIAKYKTRSTGKLRHVELVTRRMPGITLENVYNFVGDSLVLMTTSNCTSLKHPTDRAIPGSSLKSPN